MQRAPNELKSSGKMRKIDSPVEHVEVIRSESEIREILDLIIDNAITLVREKGINAIYIKGPTAKYRKYVHDKIIETLNLSEMDLSDYLLGKHFVIIDKTNSVMLCDSENGKEIGQTCTTTPVTNSKKYDNVCFNASLERRVNDVEVYNRERQVIRYCEWEKLIKEHPESVFIFTSLLEPGEVIRMENDDNERFKMTVHYINLNGIELHRE